MNPTKTAIELAGKHLEQCRAEIWPYPYFPHRIDRRSSARQVALVVLDKYERQYDELPDIVKEGIYYVFPRSEAFRWATEEAGCGYWTADDLAD